MDLSAAVMSPETTQVTNDEDSLNMVAQIGLAGRVIKFFEPKPGLLLQIEKGVAAQARLDPEEGHLSGSALYTYLTGAAAPDELLEAEARATPPAGADDHTGTVNTSDNVSPPDLSTAAPSLTPQTQRYTSPTPGNRNTFLTDYCTKTDRFYSFINTNGISWVQTEGTNMMKSGAFAIHQSIHYFGMYWGGSNPMLFDETIPEGWFAGWRWTSTQNADCLSEVEGPQPDGRYDHCVNFHF